MDRDQIRKLLVWYAKQARLFLEEHAADQLSSLDDHGRRIDEFTHQPDLDEVAVCFLGAVGVGKSTLLNALVSERYNVLSPRVGLDRLQRRRPSSDSPRCRSYAPATSHHSAFVAFCLPSSASMSARSGVRTQAQRSWHGASALMT
jgi:hypothetical protein